MIKKAKYIQGYVIEVTFKSGVVKTIDLENFIKTSNHPLIRKYTDLRLFQQFKVEYGVLCWANDWDLNPQNILQGKYDAFITV